MYRCGKTLLLPVLFIMATSQPLWAARTELISKSPEGDPGNGRSERPAVSDNGRFIVYQSTARNLVDDDTSSRSDIFLYDRFTRKTIRINLAPDKSEADDSSENAAISADGNVIAFASEASNLVANDSGGIQDIFAYNRLTGVISRVSVSSAGVAGDGTSDLPDVSGDGRYVVFQSASTNLVGNDKNEQIDIFRRDLQTGTTIRVNYNFLNEEVTDYDCTEPKISDDGQNVVFQTQASLSPCDDNNDYDIFHRDILAGSTTLASATYYGCISNRDSYHPSISGDGRYVSFSSDSSDLAIEDDTNSRQDVYIRDLQQETTERISLSSSNQEGDNRSVGYGGNLSQDGRYVSFSSSASNLVNDDENGRYDVFVRDRNSRQTTRESVSHYWEEGTGDSSANTAAISANGRFVVFDSSSSELAAGDTNGNWDIFVRDYLYPGPLVTRISPETGDFNGGNVLTIYGSNFAANAIVTIDGVVASSISVNGAGTQITCVIPAHAPGNVEVTVTNPNDNSSWTYPVGYGFSGYLYRSLIMPYMMLLFGS